MIFHWFNDGINNTQVKMDEYFLQKIPNNKYKMKDFPGGPVVRTLRSQCRSPGLIPGWGIKILQAAWCGQIHKRRMNERNKKLLLESHSS